MRILVVGEGDVAPTEAMGGKRRALVVAAATFELRGVDGDAERIAVLLERRGFAIDLCRGRRATRDAILAAYERLVDASTSGDAAVVYFAGHGGRASNTDPRAGHPDYPEVPRTARFIVPTDYDVGTDRDFRGILAGELSLALAALTARTANATVIFDCCHAGEMTRSADDAQARRLPDGPRLELSRRLDELRGRGGPTALDPLANPDAVRLLACGDLELAWEQRRGDGLIGGVFTEALLGVLAEAPSGATWDSISHATRQRVTRRVPSQRPVVGGPVARRLFELDRPASLRAIAVRMNGGVAQLELGRLGSLVPGSTVTVMPPGSSGPDPAHQIARAKVVGVGSLTSELALDALGDRIPAGALAFIEPGAPALRLSDALVGSISAGDQLPAGAVNVSWGWVIGGACAALPNHGAVISPDERLYVRVDNRERIPLFVHLLVESAGGPVSLTRRRATTGQVVEPGHSVTLGAVDSIGPVGMTLRSVAPTAVGPCALTVIATTEPIDLGMLTEDAGDPAPCPAQTIAGQVRDVATGEIAPGFAVSRRTFTVDPAIPRRHVRDAAAPSPSAGPAPASPAAIVDSRDGDAARPLPDAPGRSWQVSSFDDRLTLLYVAADPGRTRSIAVARESSRIERELALSSRRRLAIHLRLGTTPEDLVRFVRELSPSVLHFSGHALAMDGLALEDDMGGWRWLSPDALATALAAQRLDLRVLLLNACHGDQLIEPLRDCARCVIGMCGQVGELEAHSFAVGFYRALADGDAVSRAIAQGHAQVAIDGHRGFQGVAVVARPGIVLDEVRLSRPAGGPTIAPVRMIERPARPRDEDLAALARLVDLDALLTGDEHRALSLGEPPTGPRRSLVSALRGLAALLGRTRARLEPGGAPAQVDQMLASVIVRIEVNRGVIGPVIAVPDGDVADLCRRAVAFDLDVWIESHRGLLAHAGVGVMRAPVAVEHDPAITLDAAVGERLAAHAQAMQDLWFRLRLEHLGEDDRVEIEELLPVPGTLVLDRFTVPVPTSRPAVARVSLQGALVFEVACDDVVSVELPTGELIAGRWYDWAVVSRDMFGHETSCAAGCFRVATPTDRATLAHDHRSETLFRIGAWDDLMRRLWSTSEAAGLCPDEHQMLVQLVRHQHEWLTHRCPEWDRLDRCGRALSWLSSLETTCTGGRR